jgi:hypothetical protein
MTNQEHAEDETTAMWREVLVHGHKDMPSALLPGKSRCGTCLVPLSGVGGAVMKTLRGRTVSRKNPSMCNL